MKRILATMLITLISTIIFAQNANYQKAVAKYKNVSSLTATATKTKHKTSVAKDAVSQGTFYVKKPNKVLITFNKGKDALLMNGTNFTMTIGGRKFKTNSTQNAQFKTFQNVLESIFTGGSIDLTKNSDVEISKNGNFANRRRFLHSKWNRLSTVQKIYPSLYEPVKPNPEGHFREFLWRVRAPILW